MLSPEMIEVNDIVLLSIDEDESIECTVIEVTPIIIKFQVNDTGEIFEVMLITEN